MTSQETCTVCIELFNKQARRRVTCPYCGFVACASCVGQYLCTCNQDPHCMQCRRAWPLATQRTCGLTAAFVDGALRRAKEALIWDREQAMLPAAQVYVDLLRRRRHAQEHIKALAAVNVVSTADYIAVRQQRQSAEHVVATANRRIALLDAGQTLPAEDGETLEEAVKKKRFVQRCPQSACNGFVDGTFACGLCSATLCRRCRIVLQPAGPTATTKRVPHTCDESVVESVKAMAKDTRACPGCAAPIFKVDGCNQMWCVSCNTAFDWATGDVVRGTIHNPHYYEWMRRTHGGAPPRTPGDTGAPPLHCETQLPPVHQMPYAWMPIYRMLGELRDPMHGTYTLLQPRPVSTYPYRAQFLEAAIDAAEFKRLVFLAERRRQRKAEVAAVFQMFVDVATPLLWRVSRHGTAERDADVALEMENLIGYVNTCLADIGRLYGTMAPAITRNDAAQWRLQRYTKVAAP